MMRMRSNLFYPSSVRKYFNLKFLSIDPGKFNFRNEFSCGVYFHTDFGKELPLEESSKNKDAQRSSWKANKKNIKVPPAHLRYWGEILFGIHPVYLALKEQKRQFFQLFLKNEFTTNKEFSKKGLKLEIEHLARDIGINIKKVSIADLDYLAPNSVHQGVCLDASRIPMLDCNEVNFELSDTLQSPPIWLVLDSIQDPMNLGAVIRSSYFFGFDRIITVRGNSCRLSPTASKASSGAMEVMDMFCINDLMDFVQRKKSDGWSIVSTAAYDYKPVGNSDFRDKIVELSKFFLRKPTILILGNEAKGVTPEIQNLCDVMLSVHPKNDMFPSIDSLNVSVATGIILHHLKNFYEPE